MRASASPRLSRIRLLSISCFVFAPSDLVTHQPLKLFVGNIRKACPSDLVRAMCQDFGFLGLVDAKMRHTNPKTSFAFLEFATPEQAASNPSSRTRNS